jgi:hypothetical protein
MWPWIKHWRDWAMTDLWLLSRPRVQARAMHCSYEKGGLVVDGQPIPWNADAVLVECLARLPGTAVRRKEDFLLRIPGREPIPLENLRREESDNRFRLYFRLPPPPQTTNAEVVWRHHRLGELTLTVLQRAEFLKNLSLQFPTLAVRLGSHTVACQTFVTTQCKGLMASAVLHSPTSLAPLADVDLHVDLRLEGSASGTAIPVRLSSSQLKGKQALLTVCPPQFPRRCGTYVSSWMVNEQVLATQKIKAISKSQFMRSLRISDTRLILQTSSGEVRLARQMPAPPAPGIVRVGPCFLVSSGEIGMAAVCPMRVCAQFVDGMQTPVLLEQEVLVTDGPAPFVPGTIEIAEMANMTAFELQIGTRTLGALPLTPAPVALFDAEGGFKPPPDYGWSSAAEDQLQEKLSKLLEPRANGR